MRRLNIEELKEKLNKYSSDIEYADINLIDDKITQFIYFLDEQDIANRILSRINEDFSEFEKDIPPYEHNSINPKTKDSLLLRVKSREQQGAFGYFIIRQFYNIEKKYTHHYIDSVRRWYNPGGTYHNYKIVFVDKFFNPFIELVEWYLYESETKNEKDYFSKTSINDVMIKLDELEEKMTHHNLQRQHGQQIIHEEIEELKELLLFLNKKNWNEILTGKIGNLVVDSIISADTAKILYSIIKDSGMFPLLSK